MAKKDIKSLYIELLKKVLVNEIYIENEMKIFYLVSGLLFNTTVDLKHVLKPETIPGNIPQLVRKSKLTGDSLNMVGDNAEIPNTRNFTEYAHSMIGRKRMDNIQHCVETIMKENIAGDLLEAGVWRGGATIFMRALLMVHGDESRKVWVADSFDGVPPPSLPQDKIDISKSKMPMLAVSLEEVKSLFERYELLDGQVQFLKGWFKDTLPSAAIEKLSLLRADGDLYESTWDVLSNLYHKVTKGGFVIIDDYNEPGLACKEAVHDFRRLHNIKEALVPIDEMSVFWRKE